MKSQLDLVSCMKLFEKETVEIPTCLEASQAHEVPT